MRVAKRLASQVTAGPTSSQLPEVAREVEQDLRTLEVVMRELDVEPSGAKDALARVGEWLARIKTGRVFVDSRLADLLDLEMLVVGIAGKRALWLALCELDGRIEQTRLDELIERANSQFEIVEQCRRDAARRAFDSSG